MARKGNRVDIRVRVTGEAAAQMQAVESQFTGSMKIMIDATDKLGNAQKKGSEVTKTFGASLQQIAIGALRKVGEAAVQLAARGIAELAGAMKDAVVHAVGFERAMAEVSTLVNTSEVDMEGLASSVRALNLQFGGGNVAQAQALYQTISAGATTAGQAIEVMTQANRLALGGVTDVGNAVDGLTSVMNAYGVTTSELGAVSDRFFVAMRDGKTTVGELSQSIGTVAPIAKAAGISMDDLFASLSAVTTGGIETNKAAIFLRQAFTSLIKPTKDAKAEAKQLGIEFNTAGVQAAGGFLPFLKQIVTNENFTSESLGRLFGNVRAMTAVLSLVNNEGGKFSQILEDMENKTGATDEAVAKMEGTTSVLIDRLRAAGEEAATSFGKLVLESDEARGALSAILTTAQGLSKFIASAEFRGAFVRTMQRVTQIAEGAATAYEMLADAVDHMTFGLTDFGGKVDAIKQGIADFQTEGNKTRAFERGIERLAQRFVALDRVGKTILINEDAKNKIVSEQMRLQQRAAKLAIAVGRDQAAAQETLMSRIKELRRQGVEDAEAATRRKAEAERQALEQQREDQRAANEAAKEAAEKRAKAAQRTQDQIDEQRRRSFEQMNELDERIGRKQDEERERRESRQAKDAQRRIDERADTAMNRARNIASTVGGLFSASLRGVDAFKARIFSILEQIAAKIVASVALRILLSIGGGLLGGPVGALLGGGITSLATSVAEGALGVPSVLPGAASGGEIIAGEPGKDQVPLRAMKGEVIMDTPLVKQMRNFFGGQQQRAGTAAPVVLMMSPSGELTEGNSADMDIRTEELLVRSMNRLIESGRLSLGFDSARLAF